MDDLIQDFLIEANEAIEKLDTELVILEKDPKNQTLLGSIFRIMHTIKGTCGFLGFPRLESLTHAGENILGKIRDNEIEVSQDIISIILESVDFIKAIIAHVEKDGTELPGNDHELIKRINIAAGMNGEVHKISHEPIVFTPTQAPVQAPAPTPAPVALEKIAPKEPEKEVISEVVVTKTEEEVVNELKQDAIEAGLKAVESKESGGHSSKASNQSVRVNLEILEGLMLMAGELVLTRNQLQQIARSQKDTEFSAPIQRLGHITTDLQEKVMKTRMQPISSAWTPFPRLIRGLANDLGKKIELKMIGEETELDRQLIEAIKDPLTHMVRNSADHGLENPEERAKAGKSETGLITLKAYHQGGHIIIEVSDNGRGLDVSKIKAKIIKENLATEYEVAQMSDMQIYQYIFKAGFSTAAKITSVSGRGVGMDVVKTNIEKINGTIELKSQAGKGTGFFIKIPLTLAIMSVLILQCNSEKFAIPQINVVELVRTGEKSEYKIETINNRPVLRLRNSILSLAYLSEILGIEKGNEVATSDALDVVVCEVGGCNFGVVVDKVYDTEEIVVKPVAPMLKSIEIYSGITLLGDGSVIMILDPNGIFRTISNNGEFQDASHKNTDESTNDENTTKFLLVRSGKDALKAIPIELVSRLEEIDVKTIEYSGKRPIVQYRQQLMYLTKLNEELVPQNEYQHVVSFTEGDRILGIMVDEIADIVEHKLDIVSSIPNPGYLGSMIMNGKTIDLVDVSHYFDMVFHRKTDSVEVDDKNIKILPKILLIDDSLFFRKIISQSLLLHGFEAVPFDSADDALSLLEKDTNFTAIIADLNMPGINGTDFATICGQDPRFKNIPIIIISGAFDENFKESKQGNIVSYIAKTNNDQLLNTLAEISKKNIGKKKHEAV